MLHNEIGVQGEGGFSSPSKQRGCSVVLSLNQSDAKNNYQVISGRDDLSENPVMNRIDFVKSSAEMMREKSKGYTACTRYWKLHASP